jgi:hypothetical protein
MLDNESFQLIKRHTPKQGVGSGFQSIGDVFAALGYKRTVTLDYDGKADVTHNLNYPLPNSLWGIGDVVYDGGTSEHVSNIGEALITMVRLPKVGGLICQIVPMNCTGESYYGLDPLLLHDFYRANGFEQLELHITAKKDWGAACIRFACRHLPVALVESVRLRLQKTSTVKTLILSDTKSKTYPAAPDYAFNGRFNQIPIFRTVPRISYAHYVGIKRTTNDEIVWPAQRNYPAK